MDSSVLFLTTACQSAITLKLKGLFKQYTMKKHLQLMS